MSEGSEKTRLRTAADPQPDEDQFTRQAAKEPIDTRRQNAAARITEPKIPGYTMVGLLGRGGMGVVFKAYDQRLLRHVAIKMVAAGPIADDDLITRFQREAQAIAQLQHPNIAQIYEVGEAEGRPYLVMEYVPGGTLSEQLKDQVKTPKQAAELIETLARAIHISHQAGIIHRDLKPSNILLTRDNVPKITDFGLAKRLETDVSSGATRTGDIVGTPSYMSPEQAGGVVRTIGPPSDVYSLGVILFEMLTGRPPFQTPDPLSTVLMVLSDEPVAPRRLQPSVPRDLETICLKCLEKTPSRRYESAEQLADELRRFLHGEPIHARPVTILEKTWKLAKRRPAAAGLVGAAALFMFVVVPAIIVGILWYNARLRTEVGRLGRMYEDAHQLANWLLFDHTEALSKLRGSTPAQKQLVTKTLDYLDALAQERSQGVLISAEHMEEDLAMAYERIAGVQGDPYQVNLGETRAALESYQKALRYRQQLAASRNDDLKSQLALVAVLVKMADIRAALGSHERALSEYQDGQQRLAKLQQVFPKSADVQLSRADLADRMGNIYLEQSRFDDARRAFHDALQLVSRSNLPEPTAGLRRRRAVLHSRLAQVHEATGNYEQAQEHYSEMLEYAKDAASNNPHDAVAERDLTVALLGYADLLMNEQRAAEAIVSYQRAIDLRRSHYLADPRSATVARDLAVALERQGIAQQYLQQHEPARNLYQEALQILLGLRREDPANRSLHLNVCQLRIGLGNTMQAMGDIEEAAEQFRQGIVEAEELVSSTDVTQIELEAHATLTVSLAGVQVMFLTPDSTDEDSERYYGQAIEGFRKSLAIIERMGELAPLTPRQQRLKETVEEGIEHLEANLEKLRSLSSELPQT